MTETTERFFQEIAARIGYGRVVEVHLFPVIRQGGVEGAVAVVAAEPERSPEHSAEHSAESGPASESEPESNPDPEPSVEPARHVVYTARYRHTVKGTERGKWSVDVVAEADAPLITVEAVVRGVVERSGEAFQPERITGEQFRAIVPAPAAPAPTPA
jgi:hypothetical protein